MIDILIKLAFLGGSTTDEVKRVSQVLAQLVLSKNNIKGDDFNQLTENMPIIINYVSEYISCTPASLRNQILEENAIGYHVIIEALLDKEKVINDAFDKFRKPIFYKSIKQEYWFSLYRLACALEIEPMTQILKNSALSEMLNKLNKSISKESKSIIKDYITKREY